jgi:hypothetical protein
VEEPFRFFREIGEVVEKTVGDALDEHVRDYHPRPAKRGPLEAIPFADEEVPDKQMAQAIELLGRGEMTIAEVAARIDVPAPLLERSLAEYRPRWQRFLDRRSIGAD